MSTAAIKITDAEIKRQAAGTVRDLRDLENRGLYLRFSKARPRASWYLVTRGKWNHIGNYPDLGVKQVVAALPDIRLRLEAGVSTNLSKWVTVEELLTWYGERMSRDRSLSAKRKDTAASAIKCHLLPRLGGAPLAAVDKALLDRELMWPLQEALSIDYVRLVFQLLALAFRQAFKLGLISRNPLASIKFSDFSKAKVTVKPSRLRSVHLEGLFEMLLGELVLFPRDAMLALMMLCHGSRIGETRQARWDHISLSERVWFIPAAHTKTRVEHYLPLTDEMRHLLMRYRTVQQHRHYTGPFLFPGRHGKPLSEGQASAVFTRLGCTEWTSHDLRKVARTGWADIGIDHLIGELLINHAMGHNVKVYIQSDVMARKREALERWHQHLDGKGLGVILELTGFRSGDSEKAPEAAQNKGCDPIQESTIGEVSKA
ncbi:tyrosine-type recombinase/integrase [Pseudomonas sp. Pseusp122]|uniref:tyrosine-type recombinase/integrase n=1 Tax=unclassified Pseudomonas TaxID=196821 RepID=UPI0039A6F4D4